MLVRKGIDPIISHDEINKNKPKADSTTFLLLFSQFIAIFVNHPSLAHCGLVYLDNQISINASLLLFVK
jgi:hypothetical protein